MNIPQLSRYKVFLQAIIQCLLGSLIKKMSAQICFQRTRLNLLGLGIKTFTGSLALLILGENLFFYMLCFRQSTIIFTLHPPYGSSTAITQDPHPCTAAFNEQIQIPLVL